ncbi:hypothetical protein THAOC_25068 [Thalassiosira oceanica]|uniref:Uncharacterized protein n=1 Tax=Thalassiosira oceanica TaxID=159749 RepID=K0RQ95_THAOC|nr:hypothetical protein THAOC_25068 [Thalassiosira oceanica]|eukprot:EJK55220.1 hypothetical protein THAOC_25068 [Thalassiosira oceanica]
MDAKRLFDVAAIASTLGGVFLLLDGGSSSRHQPLMAIDLSTGNFNSSNHDEFFEQFSIDKGQPTHHAVDVVSPYEEDPAQNDNHYDYYNENRAMEQETPRQQPVDVGDAAEWYGPHSHLATPVIVNSWESDGKGGIVYSLIYADTRQEIPSMIDASYVYRYEPYPDGTDALCTLDRGLRKKPTSSPCRVVQHTMSPKVTSGITTGRSFATYQVTYINVSGENVETYLPFASVLRVIKKPSLAGDQGADLRAPSTSIVRRLGVTCRTQRDDHGELLFVRS